MNESVVINEHVTTAYIALQGDKMNGVADELDSGLAVASPQSQQQS